MKITKQEVKTIYTIKVTFEDFTGALEAYSKDATARVCYENAFKHLKTDNLQNEKLFNIESYFRHFRPDDEVVTKRYLVNYLGFDGIENYGFYDDKLNVIQMVVFNYGDQINK